MRTSNLLAILLISTVLLSGCAKDKGFAIETYDNSTELEKLDQMFAIDKSSNKSFDSDVITGITESERSAVSLALVKQGNTPEMLTAEEIVDLTLIGNVLERYNATAEVAQFDTVLYRAFNNATCIVPNKIARRIKRNNGMVPGEVKAYFYGSDAKFPKVLRRLPGKGIEYLLHTVSVVKKDGSIRHRAYPLGFSGFDLKQFIAGKANSLFYSLDCQGYFNAAISAHGGFSIFSNLKAEAESNMSKETTIMIGYAPVVSPFSQAYFNDLPGIDPLEDEKRLELLEKLLAIAGLEDTDSIKFTTAYNCLWSTKNGESNFNGKVDVGAEIRTPVAGASASSGIELVKGVKFELYDTYYAKDVFYEGRDGFTVAQLKALIKSMKT